METLVQSEASFDKNGKYKRTIPPKTSKFIKPDFRPKSRNCESRMGDPNYSAQSPKQFLVPVSPCDSGVSSIESSPIPANKKTPTTSDYDFQDGPAPTPRDIPFELPKSESKFNVPAPKDPRRVRARKWSNSPKNFKKSPFRSPTPSFSPYNSNRSPAYHNNLPHPPSPVSSNIHKFVYRIPEFANSPQVQRKFRMIRQLTGYKREFTIDPMFSSEYYDFKAKRTKLDVKKPEVGQISSNSVKTTCMQQKPL